MTRSMQSLPWMHRKGNGLVLLRAIMMHSTQPAVLPRALMAASPSVQMKPSMSL